MPRAKKFPKPPSPRECTESSGKLLAGWMPAEWWGGRAPKIKVHKEITSAPVGFADAPQPDARCVWLELREEITLDRVRAIARKTKEGLGYKSWPLGDWQQLLDFFSVYDARAIHYHVILQGLLRELHSSEIKGSPAPFNNFVRTLLWGYATNEELDANRLHNLIDHYFGDSEDDDED